MTPREDALKRLLTGELPLERLGQRTRESVRRVLLAGDTAGMAAAARAAVGQLLRRGDLVRVSVQGEPAAAGTWCMVRGTRTLLDLSVLGDPSPDAAIPPAPPVAMPAAGPAKTATADGDMAAMLGAMEEAQNLDIGAPHSGDRGVVLAGILRLLGRYAPQFKLSIMTHEPVQLPEGAEDIFAMGDDDAAAPWAEVRQPGSAVWFPAAAELPARLRRSGAESTLVCAAAVPLNEPAASTGEATTGGEVGLLFVAAREGWERNELVKLARRLSTFVTLRWQHQREVNQRIHTDSLTGVFNRGYFDSQFTLELERARRSHVPLTLVIADLDHFKSVNDRFGHQVGDRVLKTVAHRLQEELRRIDHVCRIGGEEFALVLPDTSEAAARDVLKRLLDASYTTDTGGEGDDDKVTVTFSFGVVTFPDAGVDAFELYRKADAMLYLSKDAGRNRCHFWSSTGEHLQILPGKSSAS